MKTKTKKKQKLGPLQREWIRALRSGDFKQARGVLFKKLTKGEYGHCCLGVAVCVAEANGVKLKFDETTQEGGCKVLSVLHERTDELCVSDLPRIVSRKLKIRSSDGTINKPFSIKESGRTMYSLIHLNDTAKWSLAQIADFLEAHPEQVFTGPA
jgi:hypothetical protein